VQTADRLSQADRKFIEDKLPGVTGWLIPSAAYFTAYLMGFQDQKKIEGPALEFGVYHGKYLCLMMHCALKQGSYVGGCDTFELCHPEYAWVHAETFFGSREKMILWKGSTRNYSAKVMSSMIHVPPRIISVDGDHTAEGSLYDMQLAQKVIAKNGIMVLDDVYNPMAIGVSEGAFRYLLSGDCEFIPFAHICNKTFLCRREQHGLYFSAGRQFVEDCPDLGTVKSFKAKRKNGENWVVQKLMGVDVLLFDDNIV
jgi:hypothetical protein